MAGSINKVILIGNLGADPDSRYTQGGMAVTRLSVATGERFKNRDGNMEEKTEWHRVVTFNKTAENCAKFLRKGSKIYIEGRIQTRKYEAKDGSTRYTTEVVANNVTFLDRSGAGQQDRPPQQQYQQQGGYNQQNQPGRNGRQQQSERQEEKPFDNKFTDDYDFPTPGGGNDDFGDDIPM